MPLYDFECPMGHKREVLLTSSEKTVCALPCEEKGCTATATRCEVQLFGKSAAQWARAAHGDSK